jgi:CHASE3 domain sensor protein
MGIATIVDSMRYLRRGQIYIGRKVTILFVVVGLTGAFGLLVAEGGIRDVTQTSRLVSHTMLVLRETEATANPVVAAESGQRGYLLKGEPRYLEPYVAALERIVGQLERLASLTSDNPRQQEHVSELRAAVRARLGTLADGIAIRDQLGLEGLIRSPTLDAGALQMERVREVIERMRKEETGLLRERGAHSRWVIARTLWLYRGCYPVALFFLFLLWALANKNMADQMKEFEERERARDIILLHTDGVRATMKKDGMSLPEILQESERLLAELDALARALPN